MPQRYLLDANVLSELVRFPGRLTRKLTAAGQDNVCTSILVACELRFGAHKKGSPALTRRVEYLLDTLEVMPLEPGIDRIYAEIRQALESKGRPIGSNDLLIAAHALQKGCVLVTRNLREFRRVRGIKVENWQGRRRH